MIESLVDCKLIAGICFRNSSQRAEMVSLVRRNCFVRNPVRPGISGAGPALRVLQKPGKKRTSGLPRVVQRASRFQHARRRVSATGELASGKQSSGTKGLGGQPVLCRTISRCGADRRVTAATMMVVVVTEPVPTPPSPPW